jgi:hypothetical protein
MAPAVLELVRRQVGSVLAVLFQYAMCCAWTSVAAQKASDGACSVGASCWSRRQVGCVLLLVSWSAMYLGVVLPIYGCAYAGWL